MYAVTLWDGAIYKIYPIPFAATSIPDWVKNNAGWWAEGKIDDNAYVTGLQWLISNGILKIPISGEVAESETSIIPSWVKNNAGWWANEQMDENSYVLALQWLIKNGIIVVN
jgi:hypothetical protein